MKMVSYEEDFKRRGKKKKIKKKKNVMMGEKRKSKYQSK